MYIVKQTTGNTVSAEDINAKIYVPMKK